VGLFGKTDLDGQVIAIGAIIYRPACGKEAVEAALNNWTPGDQVLTDPLDISAQFGSI